MSTKSLEIHAASPGSAPTYPGPSSRFFFWQTGGLIFLLTTMLNLAWKALWCSTQIQDSQTRDNKLPWTSGDILLQFCYCCALLSHVWSHLFMDARASEGFSAFRADFINKTQHMLHTDSLLSSVVQGVHESSVDRLVCLGFTLLSLCFWNPCSRNIVHMPWEVSDRFSWTLCLCLARLEDPQVCMT